MKHILPRVLQVLVILVGLSVLTALLVMPHFEGRNVNATVFEVYFNDPFLTYVYLSSTLFFAALYKMFLLIGTMRQGTLFSPMSLTLLARIRVYARILIVLVAGAVVYFSTVLRGTGEDITGGVMLGLLMILALVVGVVSLGVCVRHIRARLS